MGQAAHDRGIGRRSVGALVAPSPHNNNEKCESMSQRTKPPFRADHVGSLLRTAKLKEAREKRGRGEITPEALKEIEDREIEGIIRKQEGVGLKSITDGEYRRISWNYDFLENLDGVESYVGERKIKFAATGPQPRPILLRVIGKLGGYKPHPMIEHFKFLKAHVKQTPKVTIPSPSSLHFRYGRDAVPESIYPSMNDFYRDLGETYRKAVNAFADVGCRYLQLDEVNLAYLCDPNLRKQISDRGEDPATLPAIYAGMLNAAIADIPPDMTITMHLCRGNFRSSFVASGGYEPVAEQLFNQINVHGYFMEYDSDRAGGFEPLRFVPKGKTVVLGLVTSKTGKLESRDEIKRRIDEAAKFVDIDQLCLSPQCGFASTEEGNALAEDEEWAKLRMIVEIADDVWG
jgi:5-methyltetrahydropteroyltriglutamate--homocysteine methyltransferase